ncbi:MAG: hypothetical protein CENE_03048 [Candidatus Celerinatantimonas neptuna]|nr:MAG: hypothetical protein CENE_03048 [Candidatus Celerinatantimonas neptuna]
MKIHLIMTMLIALFLSYPAVAEYQRNVARPVEQVVFGSVDSVRYFTKEEATVVHHNPWTTLLGGVVGGLIGNQFGKGWGRVVATGAGASVGIAMTHRPDQLKRTSYRLVELLIRDSKTDRLIDVIQDYDPSMIFHKGQSVRILYFKDGVRVDTTY